MNEGREPQVWFQHDDQMCVCHPCVPLLSELSDEDREAIWFTAAEFDRFQLTSRMIARECRKLGYGSLLLTANEDTDESLLALKRWAIHGHSRRGLEHWCCLTHGAIRKARHTNLIRKVLQAQDAFRQKKVDDAAFWIGEVSRNHSQQARRFARKLGVADAFAAISFESNATRRTASE